MGLNFGAMVGGFAKKQTELFDEAREDNREDMRYLRNHYMENVVPAYHKAKAGQKAMKATHASLVLDGVHPDFATRGLVAGQDVTEIRNEWLMLPEKERNRASDVQPMGDARPEAPVSPAESIPAPAGSTPPPMPEVPNPASPSEGFFTGAGKRSFYGRMSFGEMAKTVGAQVAALAGVDQDKVDTWMQEAYAPSTDALPTDTGAQFNRVVPLTPQQLAVLEQQIKETPRDSADMDRRLDIMAEITGQDPSKMVRGATVEDKYAQETKQTQIRAAASASGEASTAARSLRDRDIRDTAVIAKNKFGQFDAEGLGEGWSAAATTTAGDAALIVKEMMSIYSNLRGYDQAFDKHSQVGSLAAAQAVLNNASDGEINLVDIKENAPGLYNDVLPFVDAQGRIKEGAEKGPMLKWMEEVMGQAVPTVAPAAEEEIVDHVGPLPADVKVFFEENPNARTIKRDGKRYRRE